jgi:2-phospho-L-lactate guanylyltransferase
MRNRRPLIVIPCKSLSEGKSRLATVLSPADRESLCVRLLRRTLRLALALGVGADHVKIVSADPAALAIAARLGVGAIVESGGGLNAALRQARDTIRAEGRVATAALILPIDLAYATAAALRRVSEASADVVIAPDAKRLGTNLLYLADRAFAQCPFAFGTGSFAAHRDWAEHAGLAVSIVDDPALAFDLDGPEDWRVWRSAQRAPRTAQRKRHASLARSRGSTSAAKRRRKLA